MGSWIDSHLLGRQMKRRDRYEKYGDFKKTLFFTDGGAAFCCTLIPRSLVEKIGFMDERFPVFFNDGDFALRLFRAGYKAYIISNVQACHYGGSSVKQLDQLTYHKEWIYGLRAFYHKHRGHLYTRAIDTVLSLNLLHDLSVNARDILLLNKSPSEFLTPVRTFREVLAYQPPNIFRLPIAAHPERARKE